MRDLIMFWMLGVIMMQFFSRILFRPGSWLEEIIIASFVILLGATAASIHFLFKKNKKKKMRAKEYKKALQVKQKQEQEKWQPISWWDTADERRRKWIQEMQKNLE